MGGAGDDVAGVGAGASGVVGVVVGCWGFCLCIDSCITV